VTSLRQKMTEELVRRNYSEGTVRVYLQHVEEFARFFNRPPNQLGPDHIRKYTAHLFETRKLSSSAVCQQVAALRFFYVKTFRKGWSIEDTPYPKRESRLPLILSVEEVSRLIDAADTPYHRTLLMTAYGTGAVVPRIAHRISSIRHSDVSNFSEPADVGLSGMRWPDGRGRAIDAPRTSLARPTEDEMLSMNRSLTTSKINPLSKPHPRYVSCLGIYPWCMNLLSLFVVIVLLDDALMRPTEGQLPYFAGEADFQTP